MVHHQKSDTQCQILQKSLAFVHYFVFKCSKIVGGLGSPVGDLTTLPRPSSRPGQEKQSRGEKKGKTENRKRFASTAVGGQMPLKTVTNNVNSSRIQHAFLLLLLLVQSPLHLALRHALLLLQLLHVASCLTVLLSLLGLDWHAAGQEEIFCPQQLGRRRSFVALVSAAAADCEALTETCQNLTSRNTR